MIKDEIYDIVKFLSDGDKQKTVSTFRILDVYYMNLSYRSKDQVKIVMDILKTLSDEGKIYTTEHHIIYLN